MELSGEHRIPAPRSVVWDALQDPEVLKDCITGCQSLEKVDDSHMVAKVQAKVGPVKATFDANVEIVDPVAPERYTLVGEGKGGVAGFAKGSAEVSLAEDGEETILTYHASAKIGGKLAQLGSRLVDTTAKKYAADFFSTLSARLGGAPADAGTDTTSAATATAGAAATATAGAATATAGTPSDEVVEEGSYELELAGEETVIDSPHMEDTIEERIEEEAARGAFGGPVVWGLLAFAAVILVLVALS